MFIKSGKFLFNSKQKGLKCFSMFIDEKDKNFFHKIKDWWDPLGSMKTLHYYNDLRIQYIHNSLIQNGKINKNNPPFGGLNFIDVGCGGGLLVESLARLNGKIIGIDSSENSIEIAKAHLNTYQGKDKVYFDERIDYFVGSVDDFISKNQNKEVDVVTAMEVIEHVNYPMDFLSAINKLIKNDGILFISTINKNFLSYLSTIIVAEKLVGIIPDGTHDWNKYIEPDRIKSMLENSGFRIMSLDGVLYNPITHNMSLSRFDCINYMLCAKKVNSI